MTFEASAVLVHLRIIGLFLAVLAVMNLFIPGRFHWREEMASLSLLNRQVVIAHTAFIILILVLSSVLLLTCSDLLLDGTRLSRAVLAGLTIFWGMRMLAQWFFYSPAVWRGNSFNTAMHCFFSVTWVYMTATFASALWLTVPRAE